VQKYYNLTKKQAISDLNVIIQSLYTRLSTEIVEEGYSLHSRNIYML